MDQIKLPIIVEKDDDGYYAFCPDIQGCYTQGDTYEEVIENIKDVIKLHLEEMKESGENLYTQSF
ncbi:MAG: type II toxin-antitoxin system HicB family antitoxin [Candidatus Methanofastidiosa archaeon]|nr:type II toxin-antitoxin system HicB family antitoxin [Candidatus Methanofastidiosa archaeon]